MLIVLAFSPPIHHKTCGSYGVLFNNTQESLVLLSILFRVTRLLKCQVEITAWSAEPSPFEMDTHCFPPTLLSKISRLKNPMLELLVWYFESSESLERK